jgi:hypothetical protein
MKKLLSASVSLIVIGIVSGAYAADAQVGEHGSNRSRGAIAGPTTALVSSEQAKLGSMRYYGGPKSPMWRAPVEN